MLRRCNERTETIKSVRGSAGCPERVNFGEKTVESISSHNAASRLRTIYDEYFEESLKLFPLEATKIADHRYDHLLANEISDEHRERQRAVYQKYLDAAADFDAEQLLEEERLTYELFKWSLAFRLEWMTLFDKQRFTLNDHLIPVNQFESMPHVFAQLAAGRGNHPFKTVRDYENFLGRIGDFEIWCDTAIKNMRRGMKAGVISPKILMERVVTQFRSLMAGDITKSIFYLPVANMPAGIGGDDAERLRAAFTRAIREQVIPSYRKLHDFISAEYLPRCRAGAGINEVAEGGRRYDLLIRYHTTTDLTADEIFDIGVREVNLTKELMEEVKEQSGFRGSLKSFFEFVRNDPQFYPFRTEEDVLNAYRAIEGKLQPTLPQYFGRVPKSNFEIRATEKFRASSASEEYLAPAPDGSRQGIFYVPIPDPRKYNYIRMESFFLHEVIPGHHYHFSLQIENEKLPGFRRFVHYNVFSEGWALYTERLGKELGLYTDLFQYFGMLTQEMHRAVRLVVDAGIHHKGWSREQAIRYSLDNEGLDEDRIIAEVERYMAIPGQALSYKIGQLKILELRRKAEAALGAKFNLRTFHDSILTDGSLPLNLLEAKMNKWISSNAGQI